MDWEEGEEKTGLKTQFGVASNFVRTIAGRLKNEDLLYLYARFKQANDGICNTPKPGMFDFQGKQKWEAWKKLGDKSQRDAMLEYIDAVSILVPDWEEQVGGGKVKSKSGMGVAVSKFHDSEADQELTDTAKTVFDWCKEGNAKKVVELINEKHLDVNSLDESGLALLHWACDRGCDEVVETLLGLNADINVRDADGQTPLHYGVSCEHSSIVYLLVHRGADTSAVDSSGVKVLDCSDNSQIRSLLSSS